METHIIVLADGTKLEDLELNGNNYISVKPIDKAVFSTENLTGVVVDDMKHEHMVLDDVRIEDGKTWFVLHDMTDTERKLAETEAEMKMLKECLLEMSETLYA